jgi:hypothetical protein
MGHGTWWWREGNATPAASQPLPGLYREKYSTYNSKKNTGYASVFCGREQTILSPISSMLRK